jgi:hypothetical protein
MLSTVEIVEGTGGLIFVGGLVFYCSEGARFKYNLTESVF